MSGFGYICVKPIPMFRLTCFAALCIILVGCGNNTRSGDSDRLSVTSHISSIPERLHPLDGNEAGRAEIFAYVHGYLVREDIKNFDLAPGVLLELPKFNEETNEYLFKLNPDVRFDDGSSITAEDVIFTFKLNVCPEIINGSKKTIFDMLKDVRILDEYSFVAVYKEANIQDISLWSLFPILQRSRFDSAGVLSDLSYTDIKNQFETLKSEAVSELVG